MHKANISVPTIPGEDDLSDPLEAKGTGAHPHGRRELAPGYHAGETLKKSAQKT
jgi:hypothetical protein